MTEEQKTTNKKTQQPENGDEQDQAQKVEVKERQDAFVVLSLDKDVRNAVGDRVFGGNLQGF